MTNEPARRLMIIGLDGATLDVIRPWVDEGILPTFKKLMDGGEWGPLRSTTPPLTPVAWSSFMTGVNPGKHAVFDFESLQDDRAETALVNSQVRQAPSMWQLAGQAGKQVIVYNVPVTYPPERVNGVMVSGLLTPEGAKDASYPRELQVELERAFPGLSLSGHQLFIRGQEKEFLDDLLKNHQNNFLVSGYLLGRQPWDFAMLEFQHTDTVGHFFWKHMQERGAGVPKERREVAANAVQDIYRDVDAKMGALIDQAGPDSYIMVMSDHGHGRVRWYFSVNAWLLERGYIRLKQDKWTQFKYRLYQLGVTPVNFARFLTVSGGENIVRRSSSTRATRIKQLVKSIFLSFNDVDWAHTRAYSLGYGGPIYVNLKGRDPQGSVEPGKEYEAILDQLFADIGSVNEPRTNEPLFNEVHRGRDLYWGPYADRAPDLVYYPRNWDYLATGSPQIITRNPFYAAGANRSGMHRMDGIFFLYGPGVKANYQVGSASIIDLAPTALALLGVPIPKQMDGRVLQEGMTNELQEQLGISYSEVEGIRPDLAPVEEMTPEEKEILIERLRNLGYVA